MNWYVLYCEANKVDHIIDVLNSKLDIEAFCPQIETYRRDKDGLILEKMYPNYIFVKSNRDCDDFYDFTILIKKEVTGIIGEVKKDEVPSLTPEEIEFFEDVLDRYGILRMSYAKEENKISIPYQGPLIHYASKIKKVDFYHRLAYIDSYIFNRQVIAGLTVTNHIKRNAK